MLYTTFSPIAAKRPTRPKTIRRKRRGSALVDGLLYGMVAIIIIVGLVALFRTVQNSIYNNRLNSMITRTVATIDRAYSNAVVYPTGSLLATLAVSGAFSDGEIAQVGADYDFVSPYGTDIAVTGSGARTYSITVSDLPDHACSNMLTVYTDGSTNLQALSINGTTLTAPYSTAAIDAACDNDENDVALTF